ncbi:MAG: DnaA regulatory inactivator Hda [Legionellales bacterium]|nr:DnaA regulatory inactivator Hda [Legionellales bacterium]
MTLSNAEQLVLSGMRLKDDATFRNFFAGKNGLVVNFLQNYEMHSLDGFVYLWGKQNSGRTHLLHAVCLHAKEVGKTAIYLPMETLIQFDPSVFDGAENFDWICLDDVHLMAKQPLWELALFHLYNRLQAKGLRLLMTAESAPRELNVTLPDLQSRLTACTIFQLHSLTDQEKCEALVLRAEMRGMQMPQEVSDFLLRRTSRNLSDLFDVLDKLDHASLAAQRRLTVPFVKTVLGI